MALTEGKGYDDVFVYIPNKEVAALGDQLLAYDGNLNLFAGPTDPNFSAEINLYDCHYSRTRVLGSTGGTIDDMKEAIDKDAQGLINTAVMITHIGGLDAVVDTTKNLPNIPGGKKLIYTHIDMPLTAIADFEELGNTNDLFKQLAVATKKTKGLWNSEAEKILLNYYK